MSVAQVAADIDGARARGSGEAGMDVLSPVRMVRRDCHAAQAGATRNQIPASFGLHWPGSRPVLVTLGRIITPGM